jgi:hypothetical protein
VSQAKHEIATAKWRTILVTHADRNLESATGCRLCPCDVPSQGPRIQEAAYKQCV